MAATVQELKNARDEALHKAKNTLEDIAVLEDEAEKETLRKVYNRQWSDFQAKDRDWQDAEQIAKAEAAGQTPEGQRPRPSDDFRNHNDADPIPSVDKGIANLNPERFVQIAQGVIVPVATKDTEGYIRKYPVAVQHPSILARLNPELREEADKQSQAFSAYIRKGRGWVARNKPELLPFLNALQEDTDSEGGYLVPTDQRTELIIDPGAPGGVTRAESAVFTTTRDGGAWPTMTDGGWGAIAEEAAGGENDPSFGQVPFTIRKSGVNTKLSEEFLADEASNVVAALIASMQRLKGRYEDEQAIGGDGSTEPLGLRTTGAPQGNVGDITDLLTKAGPTVAEIVNAWAELPAQFREDAVFHTTSSFFGTLCGIESANGGVSFIRELTMSPTPRLLGNRIVMFDGTGWDSGAVSLSADVEVGAFGSFRRYYYFIDRVGGLTVRRDDSRYADTDQVLFRGRTRYDSFFAENNAFRILKAAS